MPLFDSIVHAFSTAGTGGYAIKNSSIAFYNSYYIDMVVTVFMLLFGINFNLFYMKNMKVKYLLALLLIVCSVATGYAQQITVKGQVWDEVLNEPLIGVNVSVKGTTNGVITDVDGNFTIKVQKNQV